VRTTRVARSGPAAGPVPSAQYTCDKTCRFEFSRDSPDPEQTAKAHFV